MVERVCIAGDGNRDLPLGHATAAWLVGVRIWGIRLGTGPAVWRGSIGKCQVQVAVLPFLGAVQLLDEDAGAIGYRDIITGPWRFAVSWA
jgi:membrane-associated protease RseP (regulator of RpoE activity)